MRGARPDEAPPRAALPPSIAEPAHGGGARHAGVLGAVVVAVVAIAVYANTFGARLTLDDPYIVESAQRFARLRDVPAAFTSPYWANEDQQQGAKGSLYRPLTVLSFAADHAVHGANPAGFHLVNVLLHALTCVLLFVLVRDLLEDGRVAFASALLFAVHPVHVEAVASVVGRAEVMALLGTLGCCVAYERAMWGLDARRHARGAAWLGLSVVSFATACFSKESGVVAPAVILAWEVFLPHRRWALRLRPWALAAFASYGAVFAAYLALRVHVAPYHQIHVGFAGVSLLERECTALRVGLEYVGLLLAPVKLSADYWIDDVPIARSLLEPGVLAALAALIGAVALVAWSRKRVPGVAWGLVAFAVTLIPVSNVLIPIGVLKAERILYTPSAGFIVACAALLSLAWARPRLRLAAWIVLGAVVAAYGARTIVRNRDWHDDHALAVATVASSPSSPVFNNILGRWLRDRNRNAEALPYVRRWAESARDNWQAFYRTGNVEMDLDLPEAAVADYQRALALQPGQPQVLHNLGQALTKLKRRDEAIATLEQLVALRPDDQGAWLNLLSLYSDGDADVARGRAIADEALRRFPNVAVIQWNVGVLYERQGHADDASQAFARARALDPAIGSGAKRE